MPRFDLSRIDVEDYLECLEIRNVRKATEKEFCFSCPLPAHATGDQSPSAYMNIETTAFFCQSCHAKGNAVTLAADILGVSPIESSRMLRQRYHPGGLNPDARNMREEIHKILHKKKSEPRVNRILDESVLDKYKVDWPTRYAEWCEGAGTTYANYLLGARGFEPETLMDWNFGYSERHRRITLPIYDEVGNLVGIKARALDNRKPKYLNLKDEENEIEPYLKNEIVFALDKFIRLEVMGFVANHMIIVEGEFNAIAMHVIGYENTVAINGSYFGARQIKLIKRYADRVTLFFDSDPAGYDATHAVAAELSPFISVFVCPDHHGDPADMHSYSIDNCILGARSYTEIMMAKV